MIRVVETIYVSAIFLEHFQMLVVSAYARKTHFSPMLSLGLEAVSFGSV